MPFSIVRDELARQVADAVVVPANPALCVDGGAGLAVGRVAGLEKLQQACARMGGCPEGSAVATPSFDYPAKVLIHAVGPVWDDTPDAYQVLRSTYQDALRLAVEHDAHSIALPLLSAGFCGCPAAVSLHVALSCVKECLKRNEELDIRIVVFGRDAARAAQARYADLASFIDDAYVEQRREYLFESRQCAPAPVMAAPQPTPQKSRGSVFGRVAQSVQEALGSAKRSAGSEGSSWEDVSFEVPEAFGEAVEAVPCAAPCAAPIEGSSLGDVLDAVDAPFSTTLLEIIDASGLTDAEVYRRANISRQHFSKIRSNPYYQPTKKTVLSLAIALELSLEDTRDLLERAGFALSRSSKMDVIVEWFIRQGRYDIFDINEALYLYDQPLLG